MKNKKKALNITFYESEKIYKLEEVMNQLFLKYVKNQKNEKSHN